jgi:hypothetical protein
MTYSGRVRTLGAWAVLLSIANSGCGGNLVGPREEGQVVVTEPERVSTTAAAPAPAPQAASDNAP